ncbi:MAG: ClpXP protease specificity-enhancing factor SspB [Neomegalonema sp.]|nr:ClpXP protease specificity-enhancing factor SspB [Neomegalonema sp.]
MSELNYGRMMQRAMQGLVAEALSIVAEHGLPGEHHFYISFMTSHPGVDIPDWLRERHPEEMMIVLQFEFNDLAVTKDRFSVGLSFDNKPVTLVVPFDAVLQFADPSAEFGLRFDPTDAQPDDEEEEDDAPEEKKEADVVSLDAFRKKP